RKASRPIGGHALRALATRKVRLLRVSPTPHRRRMHPRQPKSPNLPPWPCWLRRCWVQGWRPAASAEADHSVFATHPAAAGFFVPPPPSSVIVTNRVEFPYNFARR